MQHLVAKVPLVVAQHHVVQSHRIEDFHHLLALGESGKQAGREGVARMDEEDVFPLGPLLLDHGGQLGHAAAPFAGVQLVDVPGEDEGEGRGFSRHTEGEQETAQGCRKDFQGSHAISG